MKKTLTNLISCDRERERERERIYQTGRGNCYLVSSSMREEALNI